MTRTPRLRPLLRGSLALGAAMAVLLSAGAASAGHESHARRAEYRVYHHGSACASRYEHGSGYYGRHHHRRRGHHGYGHGWRQVYRRDTYLCQPCNRHFRSRSRFHHHLHSHHHIPFVALPFVVVQSAFGWIFHG